MSILVGYGGQDYSLRNAISNIYSQYGHKVSIDERASNLVVLGKNASVATTETGSTLMNLPAGVNHETFVAGNTIDTISSSSASDAEQLTIYGHTVSGGNLTYVSQTATLNGQNKVVLATPLYRVSKMFNSNGTPLVGIIYCYEDTAITAGAPDDGTKVHCMITAGRQQSFKGATSLASNEYWIITSVTFTCLGGSAATGDGFLEIREPGKQFITYDILGAGSGNSHVEILNPCIIVKPNCDVRVIGVRTGTGVTLATTLHGYLAKII